MTSGVYTVTGLWLSDNYRSLWMIQIFGRSLNSLEYNLCQTVNHVKLKLRIMWSFRIRWGPDSLRFQRTPVLPQTVWNPPLQLSRSLTSTLTSFGPDTVPLSFPLVYLIEKYILWIVAFKQSLSKAHQSTRPNHPALSLMSSCTSVC